jgi:hypothetical protein
MHLPGVGLIGSKYRAQRFGSTGPEQSGETDYFPRMYIEADITYAPADREIFHIEKGLIFLSPMCTRNLMKACSTPDTARGFGFGGRAAFKLDWENGKPARIRYNICTAYASAPNVVLAGLKEQK